MFSGANKFPSFDEMARAGVFHVESVCPSALGSKDKEVALYLKVNNGNSVFDNARVVDPGGQGKTIDKEYQSNLIKQL